MLEQHIRQDDWKTEKHIPLIECPDRVPAGEMFDVRVTIGKEIAHPNTTEHHIQWITLYFYPTGGKYIYDVGHFEFHAHGAAVDGPNTGPVYTHHGVTATLKITQPGIFHALSYCNIHGLWESAKEITLLDTAASGL